jgi:putative membrane protein
MNSMSQSILLFLKGAAMGAANIIPGVSGGTVAFITGIYETLIRSLKAFDMTALKLLLMLRFRVLATHINLPFLLPLMLGIVVAVFSLARLLTWMFESSEVLTWAFFFGLIVASVIVVMRSIERWNVPVITWLLIGAVLAAGVALLSPAQENDATWYLMLCGVVAFCSMIVPGLSGSFVLVLMGNYLLVMGSLADMSEAMRTGNVNMTLDLGFRVLLPLMIGGFLGFVAFSRLLSWLFDRHRDATVASLTGFIIGSLLVIWPWKQRVFLEDAAGNLLLRGGDPVEAGYRWLTPPWSEPATWAAFGLMVFGCVLVLTLELVAGYGLGGKRAKQDG